MAETSAIEWTDATWNPVTGCTLVSEGCRHCYAATLAAGRLRNHPSRAGLARRNADGEARFTGEVRFNAQWLDQPLRWRRPRRIFVCAHGDLFHEAVPHEWIDRVFAVMALAPHHTFQVLTKRPERARAYLDAVYREHRSRPPHGQGPVGVAASHIAWVGDTDIARTRIFESLGDRLPNVWLGTSVEDQATADSRIPHLLATPAAVRFLSAEPLLGPVDLTLDGLSCWPCPHCVDASPDWDTAVVECRRCDSSGKGEEIGLDWVIVGGESGPGARPMHPDWARSLRDQCVAAGVPFFFKQWGAWRNGSDFMADARVVLDDGRVIDNTMGAAVDADRESRISRKHPTLMRRVGKTTAGRELDGRTWSEMPEVRR